ncbi:hypothetical protein BLNAU_4943 [Blattamonas nauphoetae]|uniref:Uncharacterized protein n=1 Tax=Blattamonas nauphoetae TaxID=2049346 RepID=A0ABQ9Y8K1_9EUKA|nr:hypothetical protein BLNAU_4943 [Blattamonas nauphoetae]
MKETKWYCRYLVGSDPTGITGIKSEACPSSCHCPLLFPNIPAFSVTRPCWLYIFRFTPTLFNSCLAEYFCAIVGCVQTTTTSFQYRARHDGIAGVSSPQFITNSSFSNAENEAISSKPDDTVSSTTTFPSFLEWDEQLVEIIASELLARDPPAAFPITVQSKRFLKSATQPLVPQNTHSSGLPSTFVSSASLSSSVNKPNHRTRSQKPEHSTLFLRTVFEDDNSSPVSILEQRAEKEPEMPLPTVERGGRKRNGNRNLQIVIMGNAPRPIQPPSEVEATEETKPPAQLPNDV